MRILIITSYFWPENFRINDLAVGLKKKGHDISVLTSIPNYPEGKFYFGYGIFKNYREEFQGIPIFRVPQFPRGDGRAWRLILTYFSSALMACLLGPYYCRGKYDLILIPQLSPVTVGLPAILMKKIKSAPILFWILDIWPDSLSATGAVSSPIILAFVRRVVRFIYSQCDKILVSSRGFIQSVGATGGYNKEIDYFPNWAEPEYTSELKKNFDTEFPVLPHGFLILFAGNIGAAQDFPSILFAAENLLTYHDIHWVILGDGREAGWVKEQVHKRGLDKNFHLFGRYPPETMPHFFEQADVLLMTLRREPIFTLTTPGKLPSYMASGKPIIAGLDGEGAQLINEAECGLTCPAENPVKLASCVLEMYKMSFGDRCEMGERGRAYCSKYFDRSKLFDKIGAIMENVVEGRKIQQ